MLQRRAEEKLVWQNGMNLQSLMIFNKVRSALVHWWLCRYKTWGLSYRSHELLSTSGQEGVFTRWRQNGIWISSPHETVRWRGRLRLDGECEWHKARTRQSHSPSAAWPMWKPAPALTGASWKLLICSLYLISLSVHCPISKPKPHRLLKPEPNSRIPSASFLS